MLAHWLTTFGSWVWVRHEAGFRVGHSTRFHGVFAPNSPYRARITLACRGRGARPTKPTQTEVRTGAEQRPAMRWAKRLKRVFQIDVETCLNCGGAVRIIACIEDPPVIERILNQLASKDLPGLWAEKQAGFAVPLATTGENRVKFGPLRLATGVKSRRGTFGILLEIRKWGA